ncbi:MAG: hypothetical protein IJW76_07945 [Clostridia bacterium]|nr:hypothetical protein [Clostridia bacterium]
MKRFLALFLALVSALMFAACSMQNAEGTTQNTSGTTQTSQSTLGTSATVTDGEKIDFGGKKFKLAIDTRVGYEVGDYYDKAENIHLVIDERNKTIETLYNCKIDAVNIADCVFEPDFATGSNTADLVFSQFTQKNPKQFIDLNTLEIDFTKDWWLSEYMRDCSFDGKNLYTICYGSLSAFDYTQVLVYNKAVKNANKSLKDIDFYALVESGEWTLDKFHEIVKLAATDTDKNGSIEADNGEIYGFIYDAECAGNSFYFGAGGKYVSNDGEIHSVMDESSVLLTDKIIALFGDSASTAAVDINVILNFKDGKSLFSVDEIYSLRNYAESFNNRPGTDIGILPIPKAESGAPDYISYPEIYMHSMCVPKAYTDIAVISKFLDLYARHSKETVFPEYKKWVASYADGENTEKMLDYIFENPASDLGPHIILYGIGYEFSKKVVNGENMFKDNVELYRISVPDSAKAYRKKLQNN